MSTLIGATPAPGFDDPLEMLLACHDRIRAQCATLDKLVAHLPVHGCDLQARQAAQAILRYFDSAGRHHHDDEEQDLFPRLRASNDTAAQALVTLLLDEHQVMDAAWQQLRPYLAALCEASAATLDAATAQHFIDVYDRHITLENAQLIPLAQRLLSAEQLETLGNNMAARRIHREK